MRDAHLMNSHLGLSTSKHLLQGLCPRSRLPQWAEVGDKETDVKRGKQLGKAGGGESREQVEVDVQLLQLLGHLLEAIDHERVVADGHFPKGWWQTHLNI